MTPDTDTAHYGNREPIDYKNRNHYFRVYNIILCT